jgi:hypothetical protein
MRARPTGPDLLRSAAGGRGGSPVITGILRPYGGLATAAWRSHVVFLQARHPLGSSPKIFGTPVQEGVEYAALLGQGEVWAAVVVWWAPRPPGVFSVRLYFTVGWPGWLLGSPPGFPGHCGHVWGCVCSLQGGGRWDQTATRRLPGRRPRA